MIKRSSPERAIILALTIRSISGDVSAIFRLSTISYLLSTASESLLGGAFAKNLGDIEVHEIGVMEDDGLDRALHLVPLVTVRGDHVHDFTRNAVLVGEGDAAERVTHLLPKCALNHFA